MRQRPAFDFDRLVAAYYQPVLKFAMNLCGKLDRALELTEHTFCQVVNRQSYLGEARETKGRDNEALAA